MLIETLTEAEARVLGTLLEKSLATPDYYPMTLNALRNACNQKSSRDPVSEYDEAALASALAGLKRKCLVTFIPYGSQGTQFKYRHFLEDIRFNLGRPELAVLAVLLLRGGQTLNEIRLRASSLEPIDSLETAEKVLRGLAERAEPLAELLSKRPGWKEPRWRDTVRVHGEEPASSDSSEGTAAEHPRPSQDIEALREEVAFLRSEYAALKAIVDGIKAELGA
ncbi:MAG: DUF480 domain-containing protein [Fibrobacteria bacterium]